ncbi:hypothetical protein RRG08_066863 [Elysia crispata]|uniref:Uncharacterized protein n=1 Tax=Elysia crispata TaxID=231223 RepID=A0AAE1AX73_9GAST|nr:hypothetical protein RRG08_066863 [Elysia crispata]
MYNWNTWMVMEVSYFVTPATETGFRTSCFSDQPKCSAFPVRATSFFVTLTRSELGIDVIQVMLVALGVSMTVMLVALGVSLTVMLVALGVSLAVMPNALCASLTVMPNALFVSLTAVPNALCV